MYMSNECSSMYNIMIIRIKMKYRLRKRRKNMEKTRKNPRNRCEKMKCESHKHNDCENNKTVKTNVNQTSKQAYYMLSSSSSSLSLVLLCYAMLWKSYHGVILFKLFELLLEFILGCSHAHLSLRCEHVCDSAHIAYQMNLQHNPIYVVHVSLTKLRYAT